MLCPIVCDLNRVRCSVGDTTGRGNAARDAEVGALSGSAPCV